MAALFNAPFEVHLLLAFIVGSMLGSFMGLVVHRLPKMLLHASGEQLIAQPYSLSLPVSHCVQCDQRLKWWHNIPLLSYLLMRGRCKFCGVSYGLSHVLQELALGLVWLSCVVNWGWQPQALVWAGFFSLLLTLLLIDAQTMLLPDCLTLSLMWSGLLLSTLALTGQSASLSLYGAAVGFSLLAIPSWIFYRLRGYEGMGSGDSKLLAAIGAWLGPWPLMQVMFIAAASSVAWVLLAHKFWQRPTDEALPFGPFLILAAVAMKLWVDFYGMPFQILINALQ